LDRCFSSQCSSFFLVRAARELNQSLGLSPLHNEQTLYKNLDYQLDDLLVDCRYSDALKQIGSFSFLSHFLALNPATPISAFDIDEDMQATPSFLLSAVLGTIQSSYGPFSPYKLAEDDILFFLWWCVDQQTKSEEEMAAGFEADAMFELVHVRSIFRECPLSSPDR
jgi:hypothetical protein